MAGRLQRGRLYQRRADGKIFLSLGFQTYVAIGWGMVSQQSGGTTFFSFPKLQTHSAAIANVEFLSCMTLSTNSDTAAEEPFAGIPFDLCSLVLSSCCPYGVGICKMSLESDS